MIRRLRSTVSRSTRACAPSAVCVLLTSLLLCSVVLAPHTVRAQTSPFRVAIRFGVLDTTSYPSLFHATEWKQQLIADLYDSAGHLLPPSASYMYTWGVDFCRGLGMAYGWAAGYGLSTISPDGNKLKSEPGCCDRCPFQTYIVSVRVRVDEDVYQADPVLIPNIPVPTEPGAFVNYPNPFSSRTTIRFQVSEYSHVQLRVSDMLGRSVGELLNQYLIAGYHTVSWQPMQVAGGIYFYRLTIKPNKGAAFTHIDKMVLLK